MRRNNVGLHGLWLVLVFIMGVSRVWAVGPDPSRDWRTAETEHFQLHFEARHRAQAERVAELAEQVYPRVTEWLDWMPRSRTHVVLADYTDQANGMATPLPSNALHVFLAPPGEGELLQNSEWMRLVFTHEFIHIVHLDKASGSPLSWRNVFGRMPFLFPNAWQPSWLIEGLATYGESTPSQKIGRLKNSSFEALMRVEAAKGFISLREVNADGRALPLSRAYLYGAYFYDFLAERYSARAVPALVASYSDNMIPFRIHSNPEWLTGKTMDVLWEEFIDSLKLRFAAQQSALQSRPEQLGQKVLQAPDLGSLAQGPEGSLYAVSYDGLTQAQLLQQAPAKEPRSLAKVARDARLDVSATGNILLVQPDIVNQHDFFNDLYVVRPDLWGSLQRLTTGGRWREAVWWPTTQADATGFAGLKQGDDGLLSLWRMDAQGVAQTELYRASPDELLLGLSADALHPERSALAFISLQKGLWRLMEWTPAGVRLVLSDSAIKHSLHYGADLGEWLLVADYSAVPNVWRVKGAADTRPVLQQLTHAYSAVTGISGVAAGQGVYVKALGPAGELIHYLPPNSPALSERSVDSVTQVSLPDKLAPAPLAVLSADEAYRPWVSLLPQSWFPVLQIADGAFMLGAQLFGSDVLGTHQYIALPVLELTQGEALGQLTYLFDDRLAVSALRQMRVLVPMAGSQKVITDYLIDESLQVLALLPHTHRTWGVFAGMGVALDRSTYKNVPFQLQKRWQDQRLLGAVIGVDSRRVQWLSEGPSEGVNLNLLAEQGLAGSDFPGAAQHFSGEAYWPLGRSVLAARLRFSRADVDAQYFSLGGIEGVFLQNLPVLGQRSFGLRGYKSNAQAGDRLRMGSLEWRVPLADIDRHFMLPPVGINRLSAAFFVEAGSAWWQATTTPNDLRARGVELLGEIKVGYRMQLDVRLGYVEALDPPKEKSVYFSVGRAF